MSAPPLTLTALDAPHRLDHAFLGASDHCAYLAPYLAGARDDRDCNRLIRHFKCRPSVARHDPQHRHHKQLAIETLAQWLRAALTREEAERSTWVPIPPSKRYGDPDYDDRLVRTLRLAFDAYDVDVRCLLQQIRSTVPDHTDRRRGSAAALYDNLRLDITLLSARPVRQRIALFDDVLTSGKHYFCCRRRLMQVLPSAPIAGVFLMRRQLPARWRSRA